MSPRECDCPAPPCTCPPRVTVSGSAPVGGAQSAHFERPAPTVVVLNENTRRGNETGAGILRNRCAFTSRDMGADWPEAFVFAVVTGWDEAMDEMACRWGWDEALVEFLRDAHRRFAELADRRGDSAHNERPLIVGGREPVAGDVVRFECVDHPDDSYTDVYLPRGDYDPKPWVSLTSDPGERYSDEDARADHLDGWTTTLLVDGSTGRAAS